jgi:diguanylate cyclase (GGDEF)-like protein
MRDLIAAIESGAAMPRDRRSIAMRRLCWAAILLLGLSAGAVGGTIWQLRNDAIKDAIRETGNIATILAGQLSRSIGSIDAALLDVQRESSGRDLQNRTKFHAAFSRRDVYDTLHQYVAKLPQIFNMAIADADGQVVVTTAAWPAPAINIADRDYFQSARTGAGDQLSTSIPITNRIDGTQTVVFARRLENSAGQFAGIVFASVNSKTFAAIYESTHAIHSLIFNLIRQDGTILFRYPDSGGFAGQRLSGEAIWQDAVATGTKSFRILAKSDGNYRYVSVSAVPEYPLFVNISVTEGATLAGWARRAAAIGIGSATLLLCSIFLLVAMMRQMGSLRASEASLVQKSGQLAHMARYDALTGLANRTLFMEKTNDALARMKRYGERFSILMLDLDQFKPVNDLHGHAIGDSLLKTVAERLHGIVRDVDCVARLGGDEFAIIQIGEQNPPDSSTVLARRILAAIPQVYDLDGREVVVGVSIGIALAPEDGSDADTLIRNADLALYKAKSEGRNRYRFFETSMTIEERDRRDLKDDMREGLARGEFELHYQTIIDAASRECWGAEALVRWRHPERGLLLPEKFIGLAEASGLIIPLGEWVLRTACADAAKWPPHLKVAVNLSPVQFRRTELLNILKSALGESGLQPNRLDLEITETVFVENSEENLLVLHELKDQGVSIALDDFGIGYSSMRCLQILPLDKIKIDKSFIQRMTTHADSAAIVVAVGGLGRSLGIETTAEGVETPEQFTLVRSAGCQLAQGDLFSRPVPVSELSFERPESLRHDVRAA